MAGDQRPLCYLVSGAGIPNYGDELITMTWLRYLAEVAPHAEIVVDCLGPDAARARLAGIHPGARFTSTLTPLCREIIDVTDPVLARRDPYEAIRRVDPGEAFRFVARVVEDPGRLEGPGQVAAYAEGIADLLRARVVHLLGGGYINSLWPIRVGLVAAASAATRISGATAAMTGQGLMPLSSRLASVLRGAVEPFAMVDVRDEQSADQLAAPRAICTVDDVFLGIGQEMFGQGESCDVMVSAQAGIALADSHDDQTRELAGFIIRTLRGWGVSGDRAGFVECRPQTDAAVYSLVREVMPGVRYWSLEDVMTAGLPVAAGQRWISTRFHPHLVAAAAGLPGIALSSVVPDYYDPKHTSLIAQGSGWQLVKVSDAAAEPAGRGFPAAALERGRKEKRAVADAIYAAVTRA